MPRISDVITLYQQEQPIITIRKRITVQNLATLIGKSYSKLAA